MREGPETFSTPPKDQRNTDVIDLLLVLSHRKRTILLITLAVGIGATALVFLLPSMYTATTTIFPPSQSQSSLSSLLGQLGILGELAGKDLGMKDSSDLFVAMLRSRTIADRMVNKYDLRSVYRVKRNEDARKKLGKRSEIASTDEGLISISISDRDPNRAAEIANSYVDELHALNAQLAITEASRRRMFYEQSLDREREQLAASELALEQVQEKTGFINPETQGKAIVEALADAKAQVALHEVQIRTMRKFATENNPDLVRAEEELAGLREQVAKLEHNPQQPGNGNLQVATRRLPEVEITYIRKMRDLKYHEALYEFLGKQLEAARIDESKDPITVQVVDKAIPPESKSSPKRMLLIASFMAAAFVLSCVWILISQAIHRLEQDPTEGGRLYLLRHSLRFSQWTP